MKKLLGEKAKRYIPFALFLQNIFFVMYLMSLA